MNSELLASTPACYSVAVVRGRKNPLHYELPRRLKRARDQAGLSRLGLATKAGVSDATVLYIETSHRIPTVATIARLSTAIGLSAAWLAYGLGEQGSTGEPHCSEGMAERLRSVRGERGLNRTDLARIAERTPGTVSGIENGGQAGVDTIEQLAKALGISPAWLAYGAGPQVLPSRRGARAVQSAADR